MVLFFPSTLTVQTVGKFVMKFMVTFTLYSCAKFRKSGVTNYPFPGTAQLDYIQELAGMAKPKILTV